MRPSKPSSDPFRSAFEAWQPSVEPCPQLAEKVLARARQAPRSGVFAAVSPHLFVRMAVAAALLAIGMLGGLWHAQDRAEREAEAQLAWLLSINPVGRAAHPSAEASVGRVERLDWIRREFDLSAGQFQRLGRLEERFTPEFESLYHELHQLEASYAAFDVQRRNGGMVDFMALYEVLQERDAVRSTSLATSAGFLSALFVILDPTQQSAFHQLLARSAPELANAVPMPRDA